jgi:hypothetical protein
MPEHGEFSPELNQWYCSYWVSKEHWVDIHHYSPPDVQEKVKEEIKEDL